ncbi:TetR/AcrR family transcriptional regulator [Companilactobacillus sp. DQM5]|uniref:TetR/AcrR family transcriptional regulator n=1 Tax=Companilactobacillus sp. DQM5 TaxID=3463359 RepID=UPI0040596F22
MDRRSLKTQRSIEKSFIYFLEAKPINEISVTEITKKADLNRRTFYIHYKDIYDLQNKTEKHALTEFSKMVEAYNANEKSIKYFTHVLNYVFDNMKELGILCRNKDSNLMNNLLKLTIKRGIEILPFKNNDDGNYILSYTCWGMIGFMHTLIKSRNNFDENTIEMMTSLINNSIRPYLEEKK